MARRAEITLYVDLDDNQYPEKIAWKATDLPNESLQSCNAFLLSIWDSNQRSTYSIDLWTKEMLIDDMKDFFAQTFLKLADTYYNSTRDSRGADMIKIFANNFNKSI
ncbi:gliding motility protein GldC [Melioribacteraceae bacterium 4301-Me]|uniref:gliding motility protein GldC n=1 Tax=Pyranulibacter aquaticus TaxID=3163344 RepID=UPI0035963281